MAQGEVFGAIEEADRVNTQLRISDFFRPTRCAELLQSDCDDYTDSECYESFDIIECIAAEPTSTPQVVSDDTAESKCGSFNSQPKACVAAAFPRRHVYKGSCSSPSSLTTQEVAHSAIDTNTPKTIRNGGQGGRKITGNESSRKNQSTQEGSTFCATNVRHSQKTITDRREAPNFGLPPTESFPSHIPFQNGRTQYCKRTTAKRRLDDINRPEISLFASGDSKMLSTPPHVSMEETICLLHDSPVRFEYSPQNFYEVNATGSTNSTPDGGADNLLSGRHPSLSPLPRGSCSSDCSMGTNIDRTGVRYKLGKVATDTDSKDNIFGSGDRLPPYVFCASRGEIAEDSADLPTPHRQSSVETIHCQTTGQLPRDTELHQRMLCSMQDVHALHPQGSNEGIEKGVDKGYDIPICGSKRGMSVVARALATIQRPADLEDPHCNISAADRCERSGLGGSAVSTRPLSDLHAGAMVEDPNNSIQQRARNDGGSFISQGGTTKIGQRHSDRSEDTAHRIRQYNHSADPASEGQHENNPKRSGQTGLADDKGLSIQIASSVSPRSGESDRGRSQSHISFISSGKSTKSSGISSHRPEIRSTFYRPIRQRFQSPTSKVCDLEVPFSGMEDRRFQLSMDSAERAVFIPPLRLDSKSPEQGDARESNSRDRYSNLASPTVVAATIKSGNSVTNPIAISPRSFYGSKRSSSKPGMELSRVAYIRKKLTGRGFSTNAIDTVLESWKDSRDYDSAWHIWSMYCTKGGHSLECFDTVAEANFVSEMRLERQWRANTSFTICSRIRTTIEVANGTTTATAFRRGLARSAPVTSEHQEMTLDVKQVERHLLQVGSQVDKPIKELRAHTLTLLSLYFGCRSADKAHILREVGIQFEPVCRIRFWNTKEMRSLSRMRQPLWTKWFEIEPDSRPALDLVSHLESYILRTPDVVKDISVILDGKTRPCTGLFVSLEQPSHSLSAERLAKVLLGVLSDAGIDTARFKSHSTRGAVASAMIQSGMSLIEVLDRCRWSGVQTLAKHYLKPVPPRKDGE